MAFDSIQSAPATRDSIQQRVLVVDDFPDSASSLALIIQFAGYDTRIATHGVEAVRIASEYRPHIALLDVGLPGLNGFEVCRRLREQPGGE